MIRFQYYTAMSLDGFLADADNSLQWLFDVPGAQSEDRFPAFVAGVGAQVMGRSTYDWVVAAAHLSDDEATWRSTMAERPTFVVTHLSHAELTPFEHPDFHVIGGDIAHHLDDIRDATQGKNVWLQGGGDLVGQFDDAGALDELILGVAPVTLGGGAPVLPRRIDAARLILRACEQDGPFAYLTYDVARQR